MSEPYTPTTEDIRAAYENRAIIGPPAMAADYEEAAAQFDRWLAAHDAKVKAEALREVADSFSPDVRRGAPIHPALISAALRSRADKIEKGSTDEHRG